MSAASAWSASGSLLAPAVFGGFAVVALVVLVWACRGAAGRSVPLGVGRGLSGSGNGIAAGGEYLSAASFLGVAGAIAVNGFTGFLLAVGFVMGWIVVLLLTAEPLQNTGHHTLADLVSHRHGGAPVRAAAASAALVVNLLSLVAQLAGAGSLVSLLLAFTNNRSPGDTILVVGLMMTLYIMIGGPAGTSWVQTAKAVLVTATTLLLAVLVLRAARFDVPGMLASAAARSPASTAVLGPPMPGRSTWADRVDLLSISMALVLGTAGMPNVLLRLCSAPDVHQARRSVASATFLVGGCLACLPVLGFGAMWLVGPQLIEAAPGKAISAVPLLAYRLGGPLLFAIVTAVSFATILALAARLVLSTAASFAHDLRSGLIRSRPAEPRAQVQTARTTALGVSVVAIVGGTWAENQDVALLASLAFAVAASANLPAILYSLYWPRFTRRGALWSIYGGLFSSLALIVMSPVTSGTIDPDTGADVALIADRSVNLAVFPLLNPGLVAIPLAFFLGWLGSVTSRKRVDPARFALIKVRALAGHGSGTTGPRPIDRPAGPAGPRPRKARADAWQDPHAEPRPPVPGT